MGLTLDMSLVRLKKLSTSQLTWLLIQGKHHLNQNLLTEREYREKLQEYGHGSFVAKMGAEAIKDLLKQVDLKLKLLNSKKS